MTLGARIFPLAMLLVLGGACGGRTLKTGGDAAAVNQGNDATGAAGATDATTTTTGGGGTSAAGGTTGLTGQGGVTGAAGAAACGPCPPADCKPGFMKVTDPSVSCCEICRRVDCTAVSCMAITCPAGAHLEMLDGECCPTCRPGVVTEACKKGQADYAVQSKQLLDKYNSGGCKTDADCALAFENNACARSCGHPVAASLVTQVAANLDSFGFACSTCAALPVPTCAPVVAFCSNGQCAAGSAPAGHLDAGAPPTDASATGCKASLDQPEVCGQAGKPGLHLFRCVTPYQTPNNCELLSIGNVTDTYCCP